MGRAGIAVSILVVLQVAAGSTALSQDRASEAGPGGPIPGSWSPNRSLTNTTLCCNTQTEPHAAVDSLGRIVVGWKEAATDTGGGLQVGWTRTWDGGTTWQTAADLTAGADPVIFTDENDHFYFGRLGGGCGGESNAICVHRSTDGGTSWSGPQKASAPANPGGLTDKPWFASDLNGRLYMAYDPKDTSTTAGTYSEDQGLTWNGSAPGVDVQIADATASIGAPVLVGLRQGGGAAACFIRGGSGAIYFDKTANGRVWGTDRFVGAGSTSGPTIYKQLPLCAIAQDSAGRFFIAYPASGTAKDIVVRNSTDGGLTWGSAATVHDVSLGDQWQVQGFLAVDSNDAVHVAWIDESSGMMERRYSYSTDHGATWAPSELITDAPTDTSYIRPGEYGALVIAPNGTVYAFWTDGRPDGNPYLDVYWSMRTPAPPVPEIDVGSILPVFISVTGAAATVGVRGVVKATVSGFRMPPMGRHWRRLLLHLRHSRG